MEICQERSIKGIPIWENGTTGMKKTSCTIRIRVYDIERGVIIYSTTVTGTSSGFAVGTRYGSGGFSKEEGIAVSDAMNNLTKEPKFKELFVNLGR